MLRPRFTVNSRLERAAKYEWCAYPAPIIVIRLFLPAMQGDMLEATCRGYIFDNLGPGSFLYSGTLPTVPQSVIGLRRATELRTKHFKKGDRVVSKQLMIIVHAVNEEAAIKRLIGTMVHIKLIDCYRRLALGDE